MDVVASPTLTKRLDAARLAPRAAMLRRYLFVLGCGADRLDDAVQEVFVIVLEKGFADRGGPATGVLLRGIVIDFMVIDLADHTGIPWLKTGIFNVADVAITTGFLLLLPMLFRKEPSPAQGASPA